MPGEDAHQHQGVHGASGHHADHAEGILLGGLAALDAREAGRQRQDEGVVRAPVVTGGVKGDGQELLGHEQAQYQDARVGQGHEQGKERPASRRKVPNMIRTPTPALTR